MSFSIENIPYANSDNLDNLSFVNDHMPFTNEIFSDPYFGDIKIEDIALNVDVDIADGLDELDCPEELIEEELPTPPEHQSESECTEVEVIVPDMGVINGMNEFQIHVQEEEILHGIQEVVQGIEEFENIQQNFEQVEILGGFSDIGYVEEVEVAAGEVQEEVIEPKSPSPSLCSSISWKQSSDESESEDQSGSEVYSDSHSDYQYDFDKAPPPPVKKVAPIIIRPPKPKPKVVKGKNKKSLPEIKFECEDCNLKFESEAQLGAHLASHERLKYQCSVCKKRFARRYNLKIHRRVHTGEKSYPCPNCPKKYTKKQTLTVHLARCCRNKFKCTVCSRSYEKAAQLEAHNKVHSLTRAYVQYDQNADDLPKLLIQKARVKKAKFMCEKCNVDYTNRPNLNAHMRTKHGDDKPFICAECGRKFPLKSRLNFHLRVHTGEKPHKCSQCDKAFRLKSHLTTHEKVHTGDSPHVCFHCHKKFTQRVHLNVHLLRHTGETPFPCPHCEKAYPRAAALKRHVEHSHQNEPLEEFD